MPLGASAGGHVLAAAGERRRSASGARGINTNGASKLTEILQNRQQFTKLAHFFIEKSSPLHGSQVDDAQPRSALHSHSLLNKAYRNAKSSFVNRQSPAVLCLGEVLIDLVPEPSGSPLDQARTLRIAPGGAPANVAVALTRLGTGAGFIGKVGDDPLGRLLQKTLAENQVDRLIYVALSSAANP